jgi:hypothetical protein
LNKQAQDLLERLEDRLGYLPQVEWVEFADEAGDDVEFVDCTQDGDIWAFISWGDGEEDHLALPFQRPEIVLNCASIAREMCRVPIDPEVLVREIMRAVDKIAHEDT